MNAVFFNDGSRDLSRVLWKRPARPAHRRTKTAKPLIVSHRLSAEFGVKVGMESIITRRRVSVPLAPRPNWINETPQAGFEQWANRIRPAQGEDHNRLVQYINALRSHESKIIEGCRVTAISATSYRISAGRYLLDGVENTMPQQTVSIGAAHASYPRIDAIYVDFRGFAYVEPGTAAVAPVEPTPTEYPNLKLAIIYVPKAGDGNPVTVLPPDPGGGSGAGRFTGNMTRTFVLGRGAMPVQAGRNLTNEVCPFADAQIVMVKGYTKYPDVQGSIQLNLRVNGIGVWDTYLPTVVRLSIVPGTTIPTTLIVPNVKVKWEDRISIDVDQITGLWYDVVVDVMMEKL